MPEVSIIMPVYNAEAFLTETIESVLSQKYSDFELVAVNDGSKDNSLEILEAYSAKDDRVVVIDKKNSGVSDTRNVALQNAKGEYICFLDSDDFLSPDYIADMIEIAKGKEADMVVCGYIPFHSEPLFNEKPGKISRALSSADLVQADVLTSVWTKLIKKSLLYRHRIYFDTKLSFGEDLFFSWKAFLASKSVWLTDRKLYGYRMTDGSAIHRFHPNLYEKYKAAFTNLKGFYRGISNETSEEEHLMDAFFAKRIPSFCLMAARECVSIGDKLHKLNDILNDNIIIEQLSEFDRFSRGMSDGQKRLFRYAKEQKAWKLLLEGYKMDFRSKISGLKGKLKR